MGFSDDIFEDDIQPVLDMIRANQPPSEVESVPCPRCGARLRVWFYTDGDSFGVHCAGQHMSKPQHIARAPDWWQERIGEFGPVTYYYPRMSAIGTDGTIAMRSTGWTDEGHWTGRFTMRPDSPDYRFWCWIVAHQERWPHCISDRELPKLKEEFVNAA